MRKRLLLGSLATALALTAVPSAQATELHPTCADGFEIICVVLGLTCLVTGEDPCHP
jgi:hypothetical protein